MKANVYVDINPKLIHNLNHTQVQIGVDYSKRHGGCVINFNAGHHEPGDKFSGFTMALMSSPDGHHLIESMGRDNTKKVEAHRERVFGEIEKRSGSAWEALVKWCGEKGLEIAPPADAATTTTPEAVAG